MLKFSRSTVFRDQVSWTILAKPFRIGSNTSSLNNVTSITSFSTAGSNSNEKYPGKTYADFTIFKGKGALTASPILPKFSKIDFGSIVEKKGGVMLKFMPAVGQRKYDYEKRQIFALSPVEVGCLIGLGPNESCEFFHDPSMKSSMEGQVKKTLNVSPISTEGGGYFFNLSVTNSAQKTNDRFSVPVSKAEFAVLRTVFGYVLPHIIGWDRVVAPQLMSMGASSVGLKEPETRLDSNYEWGR